jgi:histone acetyltransferase
MLIIVEDLQNYTHAWPFLEPVNIDDVADYYDIIKDPMGKSHCYKRKKQAN